MLSPWSSEDCPVSAQDLLLTMDNDVEAVVAALQSPLNRYHYRRQYNTSNSRLSFRIQRRELDLATRNHWLHLEKSWTRSRNPSLEDIMRNLLALYWRQYEILQIRSITSIDSGRLNRSSKLASPSFRSVGSAGLRNTRLFSISQCQIIGSIVDQITMQRWQCFIDTNENSLCTQSCRHRLLCSYFAQLIIFRVISRSSGDSLVVPAIKNPEASLRYKIDNAAYNGNLGNISLLVALMTDGASAPRLSRLER